MRILFINVINEARKNPLEFSSPAFGTLYLASYLKKYGGYSDIHVWQAGHVGTEELARLKPDIVGVSSITQHFNIAKKICSEVKSAMDVPVIMGGIHISAMPGNLTKDMDIGVIGEGEDTMLEIADACDGWGLRKRYMDRILGICYHENSHLKMTPRRPLIQPLDRIPYPARHLIHFKPDQLHSIITSRGCPYNCVFCTPHAMWHSVRYNSPEYVVGEMSLLWHDYRPKWFSFGDDLFAINKPRLRKIVELMRQEDFYGQVRIMCSARANLVDDETAKLLKSAGVVSVCMGLESGSERMLGWLKCNTVTVAQNTKAISVLRDNGIGAEASFIIGSPGETREEMLETLDFIRRSRLTNAVTFALLPYPGTKVWEDAKMQGKVSDDMDWDRFDIYFEDNKENRINLSTLSQGELQAMLGMFSKERRKMTIGRLVAKGISDPLAAFGYARRKLRERRRVREINRGLKDGR